MPRLSASSCDPEIPRSLRDLTAREAVRSVYTWAERGARPEQFTVTATHLREDDLPPGFTITGGGSTSNPNVNFSKFVVARTSPSTSPPSPSYGAGVRGGGSA